MVFTTNRANRFISNPLGNLAHAFMCLVGDISWPCRFFRIISSVLYCTVILVSHAFLIFVLMSAKQISKSDTLGMSHLKELIPNFFLHKRHKTNRKTPRGTVSKDTLLRIRLKSNQLHLRLPCFLTQVWL